MNLMKLVGGSCVLFATALGGACADLAPAPLQEARTEGWSQVRLPNVSRQQAFEAGLYAMKQWFRVEEASAGLGQIRSYPEEYTQRGGTERIRDRAIGFRNRMRRTATLIVMEEDGGCVARCEVRVQRLDTADHRVFRDNERFTDYPNETPIDTNAGVSTAQSEAWTDLPRDRQREADILAVLRGRIEQRQPASVGSTQVPDPR